MELLRCVPQKWLPVKGLGGALLTPVGGTAWRIYEREVIAHQLCIKAHSGTSPLYPVTGIQQWAWEDCDDLGNALDPNMHHHGSTQVMLAVGPDPITGQAAPDMPTGTTVGLHGIAFDGSPSARAPSLNGSRVVDAYEDGVISVSAEPPEDGAWVASGTVQIESTVFLPILELLPQGPAEKKVGSTKYPHLGSSFPSGYIPAPDSIIPGKVPAPIRPGANITPTPPQPPYDFSCRTAKDVVGVCMKGYGDTPPFNIKPISIYRIVNWPNSYYVCCSGTEAWLNPATGLPSDILEGIGQPFIYAVTLLASCNEIIPQGATYFVAGHSLGGMAAQNADTAGFFSRKPKYILTFGSPIVGLPTSKISAGLQVLTKGFIQSTTYKRFVCNLDPVPLCTPTALLLTLTFLHPYIIIRDWPPGGNVVQIHNGYQFNPDLDGYNVWGLKPSGNVQPDDYPEIFLQLVFTIDPSPFVSLLHMRAGLADARREAKHLS